MKTGKLVVLGSINADHILNLSDRIMVMHEGRLSGEFTAAEATQEVLMAAAVGKQYGTQQETA